MDIDANLLIVTDATNNQYTVEYKKDDFWDGNKNNEGICEWEGPNPNSTYTELTYFNEFIYFLEYLYQ